MMSRKEISQKISEYKTFLEDKLKKDLGEIEKSLNDKIAKYKEWEEVQNVARSMNEFKEKDVDVSVRFPIGNGVHANAEVCDFERAYISIGLDYLLEMDGDEADKYASIRMRSLQKDIEHYRKLAVNVKVNIKMVLLAINELQTLNVSNK